MTNNTRHLQLRLSPATHAEITSLAAKYKVSASDVVRGALFFGLPVFEVMNGLQNEMLSGLVEILKRDSRFRPGD